MYVSLTSNMLAYLYSNSNKVYGDTKPLVVSPSELPEDAIKMADDGEPHCIDDYLSIYIENIKTSEITVTFKPKYRELYTDKQIAKILRITMQCFNMSYILVPEYGDNHNLHYHGIIWGLSNVKAQVKRDLNMLFGRTTVTSIRNTENYLEYLRKERTLIDAELYKKLIIYSIV